MAKKIEIELDVKGNIVESTKNLKAMKMELKGLDVGTAEFKKLYNEIDDLEDKIKSAKGVSSDWVDSLESAGGPLGMVGAGLNKVKVATQSFGAALKATGIGLIVSLIGGLVAAFSQTEGSMKKLEPLLIAMEQIFGGILEALSPLIDGFVELALQVMPYVTKAFKVVYSAVTAVFQSLGKLGGAIVKLFKGDFKGAWEDAKASVTSFSDNYEAATERFDKGAKKMTKTQKKNAEDAKAIADKALQERLKRMEAEDKIDEATLAKLKAETLALADTEQQKLDVERAFAKKSYDLKKKELEDKQALYKKDSVEYKGYTAELLNLQAEYINTQTANDDKQKQINLTKQKDFYQKEKLDYQSKLDERVRDTDKVNELELQALDLQLKKGQIKQYEYNVKLHDLKRQQLADKMAQLKQEQTDEEDHYTALYNKGKITKEDYLAQLQDLQKRYGDKQLETLKQQGENEFQYAQQLATMLVETKQYEKDAIIALEEAKINAIATLGNIITQLAGKNKDLQILGLLVSQGAAIADILTKYFTRKAELIGAKAVYAAMIPNPITAAIGIAGVAATTAGLTANTIGMAAGLAGVGAAIASGISSINSAASGAGGNASSSGAPSENSTASLGRNYGDGGMIYGPRHAGGGVMINAEGGEAVMTRGAVTMFGPLLSALNQSGGGVSFGSSMVSSYDNPARTNPAAEQQPMIMKTYVVSNELTTAAEKQARLKDLSTL
jgi:hypothetical protein